MTDQVVVSGTLHIATKDGEAMFFHDTIDFSQYAGTDSGHTRYLLTFTDAAGVKAYAYTGDRGGGEALGSELLSPLDFTSGWSTVGATVNNANTFTNTAGDGYVTKDILATIGSLYKVSFSSSGTSTQRRIIGSSSIPQYSTGATSYKTAQNQRVTFTAAGIGGTATFTDVIFSGLTDIPTTGLHLLSAANGSTRNMQSVEASFNPNTVVLVSAERVGGVIATNSLNKGLVGYWPLDQVHTKTGTTNLVTNGTFDSDTAWAKSGTEVTISGGTANWDGTQIAAAWVRTTTAPLVIGKKYKITYTVSNYSAGGIKAFVGSSGGNPLDTYKTANGTYTVVSTAVGGAGTFWMWSDADFIGSIDNVTVYDVSGDYCDLSAQSNHGTAVGSPTPTTDRFGVADKALAFNGINQYIDLSSTRFLTKYAADTKGSFSLWIYPEAINNRVFAISKGTDTSNWMNVEIDTSGYLYARSNGAPINIKGSVDIRNAWHHIALTQDGSTSRLYMDGVEVGTSNAGWIGSLSDLAYFYIGAFYYNNSLLAPFDGKIDDFRYYSGRALSQAEVTALYQSSGPGNITYTP